MSQAKARPLIFSATSIRAVLDGRKSMTRRVISINNSLVDGARPRADAWAALDFDRAWIDPGHSPAGNPGPYLKVPTRDDEAVHRVYSKAWKGDRLWARETFSLHTEYCGKPCKTPYVVFKDGSQKYQDGEYFPCDFHDFDRDPDSFALCHFRSPIFMPRWASRLSIEYTAVRPERVQDISQEDAKAEGVDPAPHRCPDSGIHDCYRCAFRVGWTRLNGARGFGWDRNPWAWAITFIRVEV